MSEKHRSTPQRPFERTELDHIETALTGFVLVQAASGRPRMSCFGERLFAAVHQRLLDGLARDGDADPGKRTPRQNGQA